VCATAVLPHENQTIPQYSRNNQFHSRGITATFVRITSVFPRLSRYSHYTYYRAPLSCIERDTGRKL